MKCITPTLIRTLLTTSSLSLVLAACTVQTAPPVAEPGYAAAGAEAEPGADPEAPVAEAPVGDMEEHPPVVCHGNEDIELVNAVIDAPDIAIHVVGNCNVTVVNSEISAGNVAISIQGNGDVRLQNSTVQGGQAAVSITGNGDVYAKDTTFTGQKVIVGNGDYNDEGGNTWK